MADFKNTTDTKIENVYFACYQAVKGGDRDKYNFVLGPDVCYREDDPHPWGQWKENLRQWRGGLRPGTKTISFLGKAPLALYMRAGVSVGHDYDLRLMLGRTWVEVTARTLLYPLSVRDLPCPVKVPDITNGLAVLFVTQIPNYTFNPRIDPIGDVKIPRPARISKVWNACLAPNKDCHEVTAGSFDDDAAHVVAWVHQAMDAVADDPDCTGLCLAGAVPTALACVMGAATRCKPFDKPIVLVNHNSGNYALVGQLTGW